MGQRNFTFFVVMIALFIYTLVPFPVAALDSRQEFLGSWLGRATPVDPRCEPGTEGCVIPKEIVMLFTVYADGTFVGIDSQTFGGGLHTTAHGEWILTGSKSFEATFTFLQSDNGNFVGAFRNRMRAESVDHHSLEGQINAWFFPFTDENGLVILDPETGNFVPDPFQSLGEFITDSSQCRAEAGCFGIFRFLVRRVTPELDR